MNQIKQFKCTVIGDGGVGKTAYILRLLLGSFEKRYIATLGVEVHPLKFTVMNGSNEPSQVIFNVWDCAGQEKFGGLRDGYYIMSDVAIVMFSDLASFRRGVQVNLRDYRRVVEQGPVVFVWSKYDSVNSSELETEVNETLEQVGCPPVIKINTKEGYNCNEPFEVLLRKVMKDNHVRIVNE